jgi:Tfp pilus assembly protein PilF
MKYLTVLLVTLLLSACATAPSPDRVDGVFNDRLFAPPSVRVDPADVFAVSPEMKRFLSTQISNEWHNGGNRKALVAALSHEDQLKIDYDTTMTRNASEAFAARSGNCLSLVIMTAALAKEIGLPVRYQKAFVDDAWSRSGDVYLSIGHVNLTLGPTRMDGVYGINNTDLLMIDFLPPSDLRGMRLWVIEENTLVAMYMNNRAVEAMTAGQINDAYWWAREAVRQDSHFLSAYNTLGVIYWRHGNLEAARQVFALVLDREPGNLNAMSNLVPVLKELGRVAESRELAGKLAQLEPNPPFSYFNRGIKEMMAGNYKAAREMFAKEVDRAAYYHEFNFWLAVAEIRLGEYAQARKHLSVALENSPTRGDHDLYAAKLDMINYKGIDQERLHEELGRSRAR